MFSVIWYGPRSLLKMIHQSCHEMVGFMYLYNNEGSQFFMIFYDAWLYHWAFTNDSFDSMWLNESHLRQKTKPLLVQRRKTHWSRMTHICVSKLTINGSDNGLSPGLRQAIIWINAGILLIGRLRTNFSETLIEIHTFSFKKIHLEMSSGKCRPFCLGLNVTTDCLLLCVKPLSKPKVDYCRLDH